MAEHDVAVEGSNALGEDFLFGFPKFANERLEQFVVAVLQFGFYSSHFGLLYGGETSFPFCHVRLGT